MYVKYKTDIVNLIKIFEKNLPTFAKKANRNEIIMSFIAFSRVKLEEIKDQYIKEFEYEMEELNYYTNYIRL